MSAPKLRTVNVSQNILRSMRQVYIVGRSGSASGCERGSCDCQQVPPDDTGITDVGDSQCGKFFVAITIDADEHCEQLYGYQHDPLYMNERC